MPRCGHKGSTYHGLIVNSAHRIKYRTKMRVKLSLRLSTMPRSFMKEREVKRHKFLNSALYRGEQSASRSGCFDPLETAMAPIG